MINYKLGKIYKIVCNISGLIYVGSTCEPTLAKRLAKHCSNYRDWKNGKGGYISSYKIFESGDYDIILLENFPCDTKDQLHARERYYIETLDCVNMIIVGRTKKEWRDCPENKEYMKQYATENKEKIKKQQADYYQANKEKIKADVKKYSEEHPRRSEKRIEYLKQYRQQNKEKIREYRKHQTELKQLKRLEAELEELINK